MDNKKFYDDIVEYKKEVEKAESEGREIPQIPDCIGLAIYNIAHGRSVEFRFRNYPFLEEMIADGYTDCVRGLLKFDPQKTQNPFAYFSQVVFFAFVRRIKAEKKYLYTKFKSIENTRSEYYLTEHQADMQSGEDIKSSESTQEYMNRFIADYEKEK